MLLYFPNALFIVNIFSHGRVLWKEIKMCMTTLDTKAVQKVQ